MTQDLARSFNLEQPRGALVAEVSADSPAAKAGLKTGDVIVAYAALERGAELNFSFTELPTSLVVHRDPDWRPAWVLGLEWYPDYVSAGDLGHFDFALVRACLLYTSRCV